jgi:hypothetical protein
METATAKQEGKMDMQAMMEVYQKLGTPGDPHKLLAGMAGSWVTKMKGWADPAQPPSNQQARANRR